MKGYRLSYLLGALLLLAALVTQFKTWKKKQEPYDVIQAEGLPLIKMKKPVSLADKMGPLTFFAGGTLLVVLGYIEQRKRERKNNKPNL